jgi:geranylgeranyl pyrophosphate synthase/predicted secreted hydrolase
MAPLQSANLLEFSTTNLAQLPDDWPRVNEPDLTLHDVPHASSTIEWWYINSHLTTEQGKFSVFASFFRLVVGEDDLTHLPIYAHSLTWAVIDIDNQGYYPISLVDSDAPNIGLEVIKSGKNQSDPLLKRAVKEVFEKRKVPLPDRLLKQNAIVHQQQLHLDFDGNQFVKLDNDQYKLKLVDTDSNVSCELFFNPQKPAIRHGDSGIVRGASGEDMFYYLIPRCSVEGSITLHDQNIEVQAGSGWYDHEFGRPGRQTAFDGIKQEIAWNWVSIQLENSYEVCAYDLFDNNKGGESCGHWVIVIDPEGTVKNYSEFTFTPLQTWTSSRTFSVYPIQWQLEIPGANLSLSVQADFPEQEFITLISKPSFWEGRVDVTGYFNNQAITGVGFVERSNFNPVESLKDFLAAVTLATKQSVQNLLSLTPSHSQIQRLVASVAHDHYLEELDFEQYSRTIIHPIREIIDRGGKSWRSYAFLACIDLVGGNSQSFLSWLALPELLHVGSLIVDDVEDQSLIRRGGPGCHHLYGQATAINAGSSCYFLGEILLRNARLTDQEKLKIYEIYFDTLRAAHAGQAIDIDGFSPLMPEIVQQGNGDQLEKRILAVHRLKSAIPASAIARIGGILGKGTAVQIADLETYFEALGLAFQIVDDVLNLRGYEKDLKDRGEDIASGKITLPVAKAMSRLQLDERKLFWQVLSSKPTEPSVVTGLIEKLEQCGALQACYLQARELIESAWQQFDPLVPDSDVKVKLRAFSWYVLERHY